MSDFIDLSQFSVPNQRGVNKQCQVCNSQFSFINREHICKRCFRSVCDSCSNHKVKSYKANRQHRLHRMCDLCFKQSQFLQKYVKNNHLKWNQDCDLVRLWRKSLFNNPRNMSNIKNQSQKNQRNQRFITQKIIPSSKINLSSKNYKQMVNVDQLWNSFNYSFRQLIGIVLDQTNLKQQSIMEDLNVALCEIQLRIANTFQEKNAKFFRAQSLVYVVIFFLIHSTIQNTIQIVMELMAMVYPYFKNEGSHRYNKKVLENILMQLTEVGCTDLQTYKIQAFLQEHNLDDYIDSFTVNLVTAQASLNVISQIISKGSQGFPELQKGIAYIVYDRRQFICQNGSIYDTVIDCLRNVKFKQYKQFLKEVENVQRAIPQISKQKNIQKSNLQQIDKKNQKNNLNNKQDKAEQLFQDLQSSEKSQTIVDPSAYRKLLRENEQLKIRNKNQDDQINRLKRQLSHIKRNGSEKQTKQFLIQSGKEEQIDEQEYQQYYSEEQYIDGYQQIKIPIDNAQYQQAMISTVPDGGTATHPSQGKASPKIESQQPNLIFSIFATKMEQHEAKREMEQHEAKRDIPVQKGQIKQYYRYQEKPIMKTRLVKKTRLKPKARNSSKQNLAKNRAKQQRHSCLSDNDMPSHNNSDETMLTQLLQKKNEQIGRLKQQIAALQKQIKQADLKFERELNQQNEQFQQKQSIINESQKKINKITEEKSSLENMNKLLLQKLDQLSIMLMDKQQKQLNAANGVQPNSPKKSKQSTPDKSEINSSPQLSKQKSSNKSNNNKEGNGLKPEEQVLKNYAARSNLSSQEQQQVKKNIIKLYMYQKYQDAQECKII